MKPAATIVTLKDVSLTSGRVQRLSEVSLNIPAGRTAIVGSSGAGKSSLLSLLAGFETPTAGEMEVLIPDSGFQLPTFWAPQDNGLWPHLTVREHLSAVQADTANINSSKDEGSIDKSLEAFDLVHRESAYPEQLSKGEQNRIAVLRCLMANPALLLLDEPLIHVDPKRQPEYWNDIEKHITETSASLIYATHQPEIAVAHSEHCLCLRNGQVDWFGPTGDLYDSAPNQQTAEYLGPNNWFTKSEVSAIFGGEDDFISCRPERLRLTKCETSALQIIGTTFSGSYAVTTLNHSDHNLRKDVIHRPHGNVFEIGQFVSLEVLPLCGPS